MKYDVCEKMVLDFFEVHQLLAGQLPLKFHDYKGHINNSGIDITVVAEKSAFALNPYELSNLFNLKIDKIKNFFVIDLWLINNLSKVTKKEGYSLEFVIKNSSILVSYNNGDQETYEYGVIVKTIYEMRHTIFSFEDIMRII
ncbi:MAG: hypothetical protein HQK66_06290 [Desulfamplus sp.]|nr:hypothetical protein [Desulfamplus sp.]